MSGWKGALTAQQAAEIAAAKRVIYDVFHAANAAGVHRHQAGILVDAQFGAAVLRDAVNLTLTAGVPGFAGFAVGRATFWDPPVLWLGGKISRDAAVAATARRYRKFAGIFEAAPVPAAAV